MKKQTNSKEVESTQTTGGWGWGVYRGDLNRSQWKKEGNLQDARCSQPFEGAFTALSSIPIMQVQWAIMSISCLGDCSICIHRRRQTYSLFTYSLCLVLELIWEKIKGYIFSYSLHLRTK